MPKLWIGCFSSCFFLSGWLPAQNPNTPGRLQVSVVDHADTPIPEAKATLSDSPSFRQRFAVADIQGSLSFGDLQPGSYILVVQAQGFQTVSRSVSLLRGNTQAITIHLPVANSFTTLQVTAPVTENEITTAAGATLNQDALSNIPVQNQATGLSEIVTRSTPGVAADGNGFAHPLGEHADTSISLDNQPITDQQAKVFSNQLSTAMIESMEVVTGAPPAEFGDKTSLLLKITTRSGLGRNHAFGSISTQYGSMGTASGTITYGIGGSRWGNFVALDVSGSGHFLDTPEFRPLHDRGNAQSLFDRFDQQLTTRDWFHLNLSVARSWFQTPNTFDSQAAQQDQRSQIRSINLASGWTHVVTPNTLLTVNPFLRFDRAQYFPSRELLSDQTATLSQDRYLTNIGFRSDLSYSRSAHNAKAGISYWHTLLRENFRIGITDPAYNAVCLDASGNAVRNSNIVSEIQCGSAGYEANPEFLASVLPHDLTRGGSLYTFRGHTDIRELALYLQDSVTLSRFTINPGVRYDNYLGLSEGHQLQPRLGVAYRVPKVETVIRLSYARLFETPYNENLIVASANTGPENPFGVFRSASPRPGTRNQWNAGIVQSFSRWVSLDADYFWKFTRNAFDFDSLFLTPVTFPISWRKSKIDGLALRVTMRETHGFSAYSVMGHTRSRFFGPQTGGLIFSAVPAEGVFRIDHSEEFQQTTSLRYQFGNGLPWASFVWRFNSGLALPGVVPDYNSALLLTGDEQAQMGLFCGDTAATLTAPLRSCSSSRFGATRVNIPAPGTQNDDTNPTRVAARNLFDVSIGIEHPLQKEHGRMKANFTVLNITNVAALYNFLSTFSGTHFVAPRTYQAQLSYVF